MLRLGPRFMVRLGNRLRLRLRLRLSLSLSLRLARGRLPQLLVTRATALSHLPSSSVPQAVEVRRILWAVVQGMIKLLILLLLSPLLLPLGAVQAAVTIPIATVTACHRVGIALHASTWQTCHQRCLTEYPAA